MVSHTLISAKATPYLDIEKPIMHVSDTPPLPSFSEVFPNFHHNPASLQRSVDPFTTNSTTGFLPTQLPVNILPDVFKPLQKLAEDMPVLKLDGSPGHLATYSLGPLIDSGKALSDLTHEIDNLKIPGTDKLDLHIITALFRDYSFLASAYLLEPCWKTWNSRFSNSTTPHSTETNRKPTTSCPMGVSTEYGLGRSHLPASIARPLVKLADILGIPPFMSYAASYALYNYTVVDSHKADALSDYSNIRLIRAFERGLDPTSSEAGFILTHIHMVAQTGPLLSGVINTLEHISALRTSPAAAKTAETAAQIKTSMAQVLSTMETIESNMERMWTNSHPADYPTYRTFIFGITSQPLFPDGVVYEGCFDDKPQNFRGESGANDSIIPLLDNLCQVPMPVNPLTNILREFRGYRPESQRAILSWTESKATELRTREFFTNGGVASGGSGADLELVVLYLRVLNHIRSFRWRHWQFAREYIIKRSKYPVATGGSPIVTWLPNQLSAVLALMEEVYEVSGLKEAVHETRNGDGCALTEGDVRIMREIMEVVEGQRGKLAREVERYCAERGV
ncbi:hypothetical protein H2198_001671 [Neophaeococcomyces mojaviensis]|uniref:Uncharacterized protein n=1 Tax=Neophaeococcomyces mojaviensis TaxID=3383035 RepID=A0ACC3AGD2_9EURO|nr:hypothetical protein H2198_001671 [Knufia sp. JES_112]